MLPLLNKTSVISEGRFYLQRALTVRFPLSGLALTSREGLLPFGGSGSTIPLPLVRLAFVRQALPLHCPPYGGESRPQKRAN